MRAEGGSQCIEPRSLYPPLSLIIHVNTSGSAGLHQEPSHLQTAGRSSTCACWESPLKPSHCKYCGKILSISPWIQFNFLNIDYFWEENQWFQIQINEKTFFSCAVLAQIWQKTTCFQRCSDVSGDPQCYLVHLYMIMRQISSWSDQLQLLSSFWVSSLRETKLDWWNQENQQLPVPSSNVTFITTSLFSSPYCPQQLSLNDRRAFISRESGRCCQPFQSSRPPICHLDVLFQHLCLLASLALPLSPALFALRFYPPINTFSNTITNLFTSRHHTAEYQDIGNKSKNQRQDVNFLQLGLT